jgi:hypothetical protein
MRNTIIAIAIAFHAIIGLSSPVLGEDIAVKMVSANEDPLLSKYEKSDRVFKRMENTKLKIVSYFHRRMIGEAIVEKDFIRYQFNTETGKLIEQKKHWRKGLPDHVSPVISQEQAESMVVGKVESSKLYFISPKSQVFRIKPTPKNPCWVVRSREEERIIISIIDAMTGKDLGRGIPPPHEGLCIHGPDNGEEEFPWYDLAENARDYFQSMGYSSLIIGHASEATVQSLIQTDSIAMFYEICHGGHTAIYNAPHENIDAAEIEEWIDSYASMPFAFIGSCYGMCGTGDDSFSYEFRKGSDVDAVTVGCCGMGEPYCNDCWSDFIDWQDEFFSLMNDGWPVGYAFDRANLAYPDCGGTNNCMRIEGDRLLVFAGRGVPKVRRSISGPVYNGFPFFISPLPGVPSRIGYRAYYVRSDIYVPPDRFLSISASTTKPYVDLLFMNNSTLTVYGDYLYANGADGEIRLVSAEDFTKGMKITGKIRIKKGGHIKIYE